MFKSVFFSRDEQRFDLGHGSETARHLDTQRYPSIFYKPEGLCQLLGKPEIEIGRLTGNGG